MAIGIRLGQRGVRQLDGKSGTHIDAQATNQGMSPYALSGPVTASSDVKTGAFTCPYPGYYLVSGSLETTGTIPDAKSVPGAMIMFGRDHTTSGPFMLTGSVRVLGTDGVFSINTVVSGTFDGSAIGDTLTVDDGQGGLCLWSDGRMWIPLAASGSFSIA